MSVTVVNAPATSVQIVEDRTTVALTQEVVSVVSVGTAGPASLAAGDVVTSEGDLIVGGSGGTPTVLAAGTAGQVLSVPDGSLSPTWADPGVLYASNYSSPQAALDAAENRAGAGFQGTVVQWGQGETELDATLIVPAAVEMRGAGSRVTRFKASASFPADTPLVQLGRNATIYEHGMVLSDLTIHCNDVVGSTGIVSASANEPSRLSRLLVRNFRKRGVHFESTPDGLGAYTTFTSHPVIEDCEIMGSGSGVSDAAVVLVDVGNITILQRCTISGYGGGAVIGATGVRILGAMVYAEGIHFEEYTDGFRVALGAGNKGGLVCASATGHPSMTAVVHILDSAPAWLGVVQRSLATYAVTNDLSGQSVARNAINYTSPWPHRNIRSSTATITHTTGGVQFVTDDVVLMDATAGPLTYGLGSPSSHRGKIVTIKKVDASANTVQVRRFAGTTIDGVQGKAIGSQYGCVTVACDGVNWYVIGQLGTITDVLV